MNAPALQAAPRNDPLPARHAELVIRPLGSVGRYVVKDPARAEYFEIGEEEHFLLTQLNGRTFAADVRSTFDRKFGEPLAQEDLDAFIAMASDRGLLAIPDCRLTTDDHNTESHSISANPQSAIRNPQSQQSILYWRKGFFNPDRLFNWLEPKIRFFWTGGFLALSAGCIGVATFVLWRSSHELAGSLQHALRWETVIWAWLVLLAVTTLHEFAHGLTCKHYGGEVREIGFLLMFFMPCFYCNVSDAWLFRERSKRLWVTFAGGYFELFLWALAVFVWRVTLPGSFPHYLAFLIVVSSGLDTFFNFNPLIKLDGYYLLSDWLEVPNLQQRATSNFKAHLRRWLWGAEQPELVRRPRLLLGYGVVSWLYSLMFLSFMLWGVFWFLGHKWGVIGMSAVSLLGLVSARGLLKDTTAGEARAMFSKRRKRFAAWIVLLSALAAALGLVEVNDYASGPFEVRAQRRAELRATVAGFLTEVNYDEGQNVEPDSIVARMAIPDLESRVAQKHAELREAAAHLKLLRAGPRAVEIVQNRHRVAAATVWRNTAADELKSEQQALAQDVRRFDKLLDEYRAECAYAHQTLTRFETLRQTKSVTEDELLGARKDYLVCRARYERTEAEKQSRVAHGVLAAKSNLAEREKELAVERANLALLEAGSRPEDIEAAEATVARLEEELAYLNVVNSRLAIHSSVAGSITTCRLKEKVGDFFAEGDLICEVEDPSELEVVIAMEEDQATRVRPGQHVRLKARALPFDVLEVEIERLAPRAADGDVQNTIAAYCRLGEPDGRLRSGMTGYARVETGRESIASVYARKAMRLVRTEFWW